MKDARAKESRTRKRYKESEGKKWIEIRVRNPFSLFDSRDPAPFRERDLDDDFLEYVLSSSKEIAFSTPMKIVIHVDDEEKPDLPASAIRDAIRGHLAYQIELQTIEIKTFLKRAQLFLLLGASLLVVCLGIAQSLRVPNPPGVVGILREGLVIFGWVSVWKPVELILFDWYPLVEQRRLYRKLLETEVDVRFASKSQAAVP